MCVCVGGWGGADDLGFSDLFQYDPAARAWAALPAAGGPSPRYSFGMAGAGGGDGGVYVFGGQCNKGIGAWRMGR